MNRIENIRAAIATQNFSNLSRELKRIGISYTTDGLRKIVTGRTVEPRSSLLDGICRVLHLNPLTGLPLGRENSDKGAVTPQEDKLGEISVFKIYSAIESGGKKWKISFSLDASEVDFSCPKCGKEFQQTLGWFKRQKNFCPICGSVFDSTAFMKQMEVVEKMLSVLFNRDEEE
ncbi:TPA: hypothetical protein DDW35_05150 [Candidatus Sumerlaeota bacterium]|nr:hypothetical protein [Candidatus Sumerlaeota bacterium]